MKEGRIKVDVTLCDLMSYNFEKVEKHLASNVASSHRPQPFSAFDFLEVWFKACDECAGFTHSKKQEFKLEIDFN